VSDADAESHSGTNRSSGGLRIASSAVPGHDAAAAPFGSTSTHSSTASVRSSGLAWKEKPEFGIPIDMATVLGRTEPLKEYLASGKPLSLANRLWLIAFIERLEQRISQNKKVGRPQRKSDAWNAATAERNAALLVASDQAAWRKENGRERVPPAETDGMINLTESGH
jgi:hypothetical protein